MKLASWYMKSDTDWLEKTKPILENALSKMLRNGPRNSS